MPSGRVDYFVVNITKGLVELVNTTTAVVSNIHYNVNVTFGIAAVSCGSQGLTTAITFSIGKHY